MKKAIEKILGAFSELVDASELLKTEMSVTASCKKKEDMQKAISIIDNTSGLVIDAFIVLEKYDESFK